MLVSLESRTKVRERERGNKKTAMGRGTKHSFFGCILYNYHSAETAKPVCLLVRQRKPLYEVTGVPK